MNKLKRTHPSGRWAWIESWIVGKLTVWRIVKKKGNWYVQRRWVFIPAWSHTLSRMEGTLNLLDLDQAASLFLLYRFSSKNEAIKGLKGYLGNPELRRNKGEQELFKAN